ncbi:hypothetical protein E2C01_076990 [Portunus trituberculatus]|uniref:Uncharacterized protein n=1 Tax=Portunus trituberculatus TaxID=210409 RepID=A0A5B7IA79_PORTR|nr:hypothetical protein [Portunus trituberculatus]
MNTPKVTEMNLDITTSNCLTNTNMSKNVSWVALMWAAWVCLWACVGAVAGSYDCEPVTHVVTQMSTVLVEIQHTSRNTLVDVAHVPELVTTTQYNPEYHQVTVRSTVTEYEDVTEYLVNERLVPRTVKETAIETVWKQDTAYTTTTTTVFVPQIVTRRDYQIETVVETVHSTGLQTVVQSTTVVIDNCANNRIFASNVRTGVSGGVGNNGLVPLIAASGVGSRGRGVGRGVGVGGRGVAVGVGAGFGYGY